MSKKNKANFVLKKENNRKVRLTASLGFGVFLIIVETIILTNYLAYIEYSGNTGAETFLMSLIDFGINKYKALTINLAFFKELIKLLGFCALPTLFGVVALWLGTKKKSNFVGAEYGSASWATQQEIKELKNFEASIPVAHNIYIDRKNGKIDHLNEIVIGDTGAGKSFRKLIPDILQLVGNYVITDTKGSLYRQTAKIFKNNGYNIKVLNLLELKYSNTFNPIIYLKDATDIERLTTSFMMNTRTDGANVGDAFWEDSPKLLMKSILHYLVETDGEVKTFSRLVDLVRSLRIMRGAISLDSEYERIIDNLRITNPTSAAIINYEFFKQAPAETLQSILISLAARFTLWTNDDVRMLTGSNEIEIDMLAAEKTVIFLIIPDTDTSYKVLLNMFVSTALSQLTYLADTVYQGALPRLVSFELDEFANIGQIPRFDTIIATIRSRNIRTMIVLQNLQQLQKIYDKAEKTILSNSHLLYLGTTDNDTNEMIVKRLGKTTIDEINLSRNTGGGHGGGSESDRGLGRELLTVDELTNQFAKEKCIAFFKYYRPVYTDKFKTEEHKLFSMLGNDSPASINSRNNTDIKKQYESLWQKHFADYEKYKQSNMQKPITISIPSVLSTSTGEPEQRLYKDISFEDFKEAFENPSEDEKRPLINKLKEKNKQIGEKQ